MLIFDFMLCLSDCCSLDNLLDGLGFLGIKIFSLIQKVSWIGMYYTIDLQFVDHFLSLSNIRCKRHKLRNTLNVHPAGGIEPWEDVYPAMATAMGIDPKVSIYYNMFISLLHL